jgi:pimeloyl-ACP methyl ester carboxylesterase
MAPDIKPFKIAVPDAALASLKAKLSSATFPQGGDTTESWDYGVPLADIKRLTAYWADGFDWRAQEARLNEALPQFMTKVEVDGFGEIDMHFVHQRSKTPDSIPLLFSHGWPGSFLEVIKILPLLTDPKEGGPSFHVVAPSLPNFGFSGLVSKKGFGIPQYAEAIHKVMLNLGYDQYVSQGGDWGFIITRLLGVLYPEHCLASHVNMIHVRDPPTFSQSPVQWLTHALLPYSKGEREGIARSRWFMREGFGYNLLQSTRPSTIGLALADSPVAVLSWIYEKLHDWTDAHPWTDDEILTWISIYQFSTAGADASVRIYYEYKHAQKELTDKGHGWVPRVKLGLSYFPQDLTLPPKAWGRAQGPVVFEAFHTSGGHFAATEKPEELVGDLRKMFGKGGGAASVAAVFGGGGAAGGNGSVKPKI